MSEPGGVTYGLGTRANGCSKEVREDLRQS